MNIHTLENNIHKLDSQIYDITYHIQTKLTDAKTNQDYHKVGDLDTASKVLATLKTKLGNLYEYVDHFNDTKDFFYKKLAVNGYFNTRKLVKYVYEKLLTGPAINKIIVNFS